MAAHRKSDQRRDDPCAGGLGKRAFQRFIPVVPQTGQRYGQLSAAMVMTIHGIIQRPHVRTVKENEECGWVFLYALKQSVDILGSKFAIHQFSWRDLITLRRAP